jgi:hypothetical protein
MKIIFKWEPGMSFFVIPTITMDTYSSPNFGKEWPLVFGITFIWLRFHLDFEFRKANK